MRKMNAQQQYSDFHILRLVFNHEENAKILKKVLLHLPQCEYWVFFFYITGNGQNKQLNDAPSGS